MRSSLPTIEQQQVLFEEVLKSDELKPTRRLKRILAHLGERYFSSQPSSTDDVATECFPDHHVEDALPNTVRGAIRHLRKHLDAYFSSEGSRHEYRVNIPPGPAYTLKFDENPFHKPGDSFATFWGPHCGKEAKNRVLITSPPFWRDGTLTYVRNVFCNSEYDRRHLETCIRAEIINQLELSFHYVSAGEAIGAMTLLCAFHRRGVDCDFDTDLQYQTFSQLDQHNFLFIGSSRTSKLLNRLQEADTYTLTPQGVRRAGETEDKYLDRVRPASRESTEQRNERLRTLAYCRYLDSGDPDAARNWLWAEQECRRQESMHAHLDEKYCIVTRKASPNRSHTITLISANHGRAAQGVVEFLTDQAKLQSLFEWMQIQPGDSLLKSFQVVFSVTVSRLNGEGAPETVTPLEWTPGPEQPLLRLAAAVAMPMNSLKTA